MKRVATKEEKKWMSRVADLGCLICQNNQVVIHHVTTLRGFGSRASNYHVLPLCVRCHDGGEKGVSLHAGIATWERIHGDQKTLLKKIYKTFGRPIDFV